MSGFETGFNKGAHTAAIGFHVLLHHFRIVWPGETALFCFSKYGVETIYDRMVQ